MRGRHDSSIDTQKHIDCNNNDPRGDISIYTSTIILIIVILLIVTLASWPTIHVLCILAGTVLCFWGSDAQKYRLPAGKRSSFQNHNRSWLNGGSYLVIWYKKYCSSNVNLWGLELPCFLIASWRAVRNFPIIWPTYK